MTNDILNRPQAGNARQIPIEPPAHGLLRVMTYNIRIDHEEDRQGPHDWRQRRSMVASLISGYGVTIAGLQEANALQWLDLQRYLPGYAIEGFSAGFGRAQEENLLVCYLKSHLELAEAAVFSLSPTPNVPSNGWDARYPRACMYCKFRDKTTGQFLAYFNTHFDHKGEVARRESAEFLARLQKHLGQQKLARVIAGDFNPYPDQGGHQVYSSLLDPAGQLADIRDVSQEGTFGPDGTWIGWEYEPTRSPEGRVGSRLDHIFIGGPLTVVRCGVLTASVNSEGTILPNFEGIGQSNRNFPSDHLPIIADLRIKDVT